MASINLCNETQKHAFNAAKVGHNVLITGQCGTGKSFILRLIIQNLKKTKNVAVTASTGMAANALGVESTTLHHWCGLGDGRLTKEEILARFSTDDRFCEARKRILQAEVIALDEIGMVSECTFEKLEAVCRVVKNPNKVFGGLQVIACGDFKQLPPVPNYRYGDPGHYCFRSSIFKEVFPHHYDLKEVVRQNEKDLVKAINELCNGWPDKETEALLKSLDREFSDQNDVCRLVGTNFDAAYLNQVHLDAQDGDVFAFTATDQGKKSLLRRSGAEKVLSLKVGAQVILIRNLTGNLYNGMRGSIYSICKNGPIVNFEGRLVDVKKLNFEVYDPSTKKVVATRSQFPLKLAYVLTVHRAQGLQFEKVEIDCFSFFAPGQLGVAVGRAVSKSGLRIVNYNSAAAHLMHPEDVYDFYFSESRMPTADLSCCINDYSETDIEPEFPEQSHECTMSESNEASASTSVLEKSICPWPVDQFIISQAGKTFMPKDLSDGFKMNLLTHANILYVSVKRLLRKKTKTPDDFARLYKEANSYVTSEEHVLVCGQLESPKPQKLSSKLYLWLLDREIEKLALTVVKPQTEKFEHETHVVDEASEAAKSKVRYIAGACLHKIISRLRVNVLNKLGKPSSKIKMAREWDFRLHKMLLSLRISEKVAMEITKEPQSMTEIESRQGPSRGLIHVSDEVYNFFMHVNFCLQKLLSPEGFHLYADRMHSVARQKLLTDANLVEEWIGLFSSPEACEISNIDEDEVFVAMLEELYGLVVEHFLRISLVDGLYNVKSKIPRKKKQALRSKITALSDRETTATKKAKLGCEETESELYICPKCKEELVDDPSEPEDNSVACDLCNNWYHFRCEGLTGNEPFLKRSKSTWKCSSCSVRGKGKGRGKKSRH